jgi:signal transduction histidine kinase
MSINARLYRLALDRQYPVYPENLLGTVARLTDDQLESARQESGATHRYAMPGSDRLILSYALPLSQHGDLVGVLIIEQTTDRVLTLADQALSRLVILSLLASLLAAGGLLGYASYLSLRIGRLRNAAEQALRPGGGLSTGLPGVNKSDELGDLARSFQTLLTELDDYTRYLKTLGDTLAHELRTPMTVVKSSLDNLEHENLPDSARPYLRRAEEGVNRLHRILSALREAARIEQGVRHSEHETLDLGQLLEMLCNGYRDAFPERRFESLTPDGPCFMNGAPDLLAQMMDKLVENAVEFSPDKGLIQIHLEQANNRWLLSVANEGPRLPVEAREKLFDSLVSQRGKRDGSPHLGLGLHVVKLIAEHHGGRVSAGDSQALSGAEFRIELPSG